MNRQRYQRGQRWISESEPELGLGHVTEVADGRVTLAFPATDEQRMYAAENAPLKRVRFQPGDAIQDTSSQVMIIDSVSEHSGLFTYHGESRAIPEQDLQDAQTFDKPERRLMSGHVDGRAAFDLRLETHRERARMESSPLQGLLGGRIDLIPHQLYIAAEVSRRDVPRVLLADEVGLGKTIEACLILHRMLLTGKIQRALIVVPPALVHQWFVELLRRFSLTFSIFDEPRCAALEDEDEDTQPFLREPLILCGLDFLLKHRDRAAQVVQGEWDMLIVDEAHHLAWSHESPSPGYQLVEAIARTTPGLILLTATPEQLGPESHFARLRLLDPHRYHDLRRYMDEHRHYETIVQKTNALLEAGNEKALQELLDRHGTGRVMFRNTRSSMKGFPKRHFHPWPLKESDGGDARVIWLADFLRQHAGTKVLVITQTKDEVLKLKQNITRLIHIDTALFHEDMPLIQCDRQAAWFAEPEGARLLIASEIGGEGRNFQFVQHLVLIHVPDDPEMLEQRIGRLDRIGQSGDIHIHVPFIQASPEAARIRWYHEGLNAFEEALSGSHDMMLQFRDRLDKIDDTLIAETQRFRQELKSRIERGRDRLLEMNSCRPAMAAEWVARISALDQDRGLEKFLGRLLDHFGVLPECLQGRDFLLQRGPLFDSAFPLKEEPLHVTYDRRRAMAREDMTWMSWDHPLVRSAMDLLLGSESGNAALAIAPGIKKPTLHAVFILECVAPRNLELHRFLPATPIHVVVGGPSKPPPLRDPQAWEIVEIQTILRGILPALLDEARRQAEEQTPDILKHAATTLNTIVGGELQRLVQLQKINDHIRDDEIEALSDRLEQLHDALREHTLRLDSLLFLCDPSATR